MNVVNLGNTVAAASEAEPHHKLKFINISTYWTFSREVIPVDVTTAEPITFILFGQIATQECFLTTAGRCLNEGETHAPNYSASFWLEPCYNKPLLHARWRHAMPRLQSYLNNIDKIETTHLLSKTGCRDLQLRLNWHLITDKMVCT